MVKSEYMKEPVNRDKFNLYSAILEASRKRSASMTELMYRSMTSNDQIKAYLDHLLRAGLLGYDDNDSRARYRITGKGEDFLTCHAEITAMVPDARI